jgi:hypothetical protein
VSKLPALTITHLVNSKSSLFFNFDFEGVGKEPATQVHDRDISMETAWACTMCGTNLEWIGCNLV